MLITLVIIGVIAALTIPNLLQKYQEQATVKKVQKFYSNLSNAYLLATRENGSIDGWGLTGFNIESGKKIYEILFKPYFKIAKDCGGYNTDKCFSNSTKWLNNTAGGGQTDLDIYKITLDDGSSVAWISEGTAEYAERRLISIRYDVNGIKGPNQWGKDFFEFSIVSDMQRPQPYGFPPNIGGGTRYNFNTYCQKNSDTNYSGRGCAAWVIYKGNMDYLHKNIQW